MSKQINFLERHVEDELRAAAPLAERMRPKTLEEFCGQRHLLEEGKVLNRLIRSRQPQSLIMWGPPGCGKTTLARLLAHLIDTHLIALSAVAAGTREIRAAVEQARLVWADKKLRTWLFLDEIHRLNKAQQDTLLPHVEQGTLLLLGATTENPSFEVIRPLLSRAQVIVLNPLHHDDLRAIVRRALEDEDAGLGAFPALLDPEAEEFLISMANGDARVLLNSLEMVVMSTPPNLEGTREIRCEALKDLLQRRTIHYDKSGEEHFNLLSAFHKSLRGSDPDAALYWFTRMVEAGEDPLTISRRLVAAASEDVGLADPFALTQAVNAVHAYQLLGSPEGELALAQAIVYVALAPKSNAVYKALKSARETASKTAGAPVPLHLRNAPTALLKNLGYGKKYRYPHDDPRGWVEQEYLPENLGELTFYQPIRGWEDKWREHLRKRRQIINKRFPRSE